MKLQAESKSYHTYLCIYERQQVWIFNVLPSYGSSILRQIIGCQKICQKG